MEVRRGCRLIEERRFNAFSCSFDMIDFHLNGYDTAGFSHFDAIYINESGIVMEESSLKEKLEVFRKKKLEVSTAFETSF
jgi:hypothetical protein